MVGDDAAMFGDVVPPEKQGAFLAALEQTGNVTRAAEHVGVDRRLFYRLREKDPTFAEAWQRALLIGIEALEDEARRRAFEGYNKPVFQQGAQVGTIREFSDTLAIFLLKGAKPDVYRERQDVNVSGSLDIGQRILAARKRSAAG